MLFVKWADWLADGRRRFGDNIADWIFICPVCGRRQTIKMLQQIGVQYAFAHVYHRCISYFENDATCGFGCSDRSPVKVVWGPSKPVFKRHEVEVLANNRYIPVFRFAQATSHQKKPDISKRSFEFDRPIYAPVRPLFPSNSVTACIVPDRRGGWRIRDGHGTVFGSFLDKPAAKQAIKQNGWTCYE